MASHHLGWNYFFEEIPDTERSTDAQSDEVPRIELVVY